MILLKLSSDIVSGKWKPFENAIGDIVVLRYLLDVLPRVNVLKVYSNTVTVLMYYESQLWQDYEFHISDT